MNRDTVPVFVYGTLMKGYPLHASWMRDSEFVGETLLRGHTLVSLGAFPAMLKVDCSDEEQFAVAGEVYDMPADKFAELARMEERVGYETRQVTTQDGSVVNAFVFSDIGRGVKMWEVIIETGPRNRRVVSGRVANL